MRGGKIREVGGRVVTRELSRLHKAQALRGMTATIKVDVATLSVCRRKGHVPHGSVRMGLTGCCAAAIRALFFTG